ncbi:MULTISPECIES: imidazole glycerol phosphate synthase subunit HisH [unclassified Methylophaga]|jgi:glutamine amidotransferase|uniref:imidazole glycerol phosphate synthase subunit HisH n=1 Tax=unclassified Methylophaga TaxID=2629249 RepID=UPI000C909E2C|nr:MULTISPECIES: imidazole glycerol phosphate synthase subunit HisH [unclassified Methylophaga]MAK68144.1 imidazole glycerol phosphate synthase subunit HisH [Methylophaga sp.]MAY17835.1 imidazole glycerol phosphate synthase subunit HisH [Methylophaga sp.]HCD03810.1 imidazole glycerol phosphate synthase subunit HisH [Methylophaga sp.]|tara:strand:- start:60169 stop:60804 length:636 start_codon:yes stop_codon:yes gene_type:complete
MRRVAVIDYGMGNLRSVSKALETVADNHTQIFVTADPSEIHAADHIVFPGVGAIRDCMAELKKLELDKLIIEMASQKPFLGICLGMQALLTHSQENQGSDGLDIIEGDVLYFEKAVEQGLKVPHMGWNEVEQTFAHPLWQDIPQNSRFYFVHSFYVQPADETKISGRSHYALPFAAALAQENLFAVQFHPEKSQHAGLQLLKNFINWDGQS